MLVTLMVQRVYYRICSPRGLVLCNFVKYMNKSFKYLDSCILIAKGPEEKFTVCLYQLGGLY